MTDEPVEQSVIPAWQAIQGLANTSFQKTQECRRAIDAGELMDPRTLFEAVESVSHGLRLVVAIFSQVLTQPVQIGIRNAPDEEQHGE